MGDAARDRLSDAGSIPARSTYYAESELIEFGFCAFGSTKSTLLELLGLKKFESFE